MSSYPGTSYFPPESTANPTLYSSIKPSPPQERRDSAVSSGKSTMPRPHGSRSSSRSSRRQASYDRTVKGSGPRRINSAPYGQLPHMDLDAAIALHERSCALFRTSSSTTYPSSQSPAAESPRHEQPQPQTQYSLNPSPQTYPEDLDIIDEKLNLDDEADAVAPATEIRWTSDESRRREYAEIDRAHSGIKGLFKRMFPKIAARSNQSRFYSEDDGSDAGSIRRYRLDMPEE